jgi:purine-nucleoside phosphorylase
MTKLEQLRNWNAETAIILGSGLSSIVPDDSETIPYAGFKELPKGSVPGHAGQLALAKIDSHPVIFAQGRVHLYEGFSAHEVTAGVRLLKGAGIKQLIHRS